MAKTKTAKTKRQRKPKPLYAPAIKPGSREEYYWNHPEETDQWFRDHGADPDEIDKLLMSGKTVRGRMVNGKIEFWAEEE